MKRKLIKQGLGGYTIYLPKKWVNKFKVKPGDEVNLDIMDNKLIVSLSEIHTDLKTNIQLSKKWDTESAIRTVLTNTYRLGYDDVNITFTDESQLKIIRDVVRSDLIGFAVTKKDHKSIIIESITEPSPEQFDVLLRKILYNISYLFEIAQKYFAKEKVSEDFEEIQSDIKKYDNFCRRVIAKKQLFEKNAQLYWTFLALLIHGQREVYHLLRTISKKNKIYDKKITDYAKKAAKIFEMLKSGFLKKDLAVLEYLHELEKDFIYKTGYSLIRNQKHAVELYHLMSAIRNFYLASSPLMGIIVQEGEY